MAIEFALAMVVLVSGFAAVAVTAGALFDIDRMASAAREVARAAAFAEANDEPVAPCMTIRRKLGEHFKCKRLKITVYTELLPSELNDALRSGGIAGNGDMVLVRIDWHGPSWLPGKAPRVAIGLARGEPPRV